MTVSKNSWQLEWHGTSNGRLSQEILALDNLVVLHMDGVVDERAQQSYSKDCEKEQFFDWFRWLLGLAREAHHEQLSAKDDIQDESLQQQHTRLVDIEVQPRQPDEGDLHLQPHFCEGARSVVPQHIAVFWPRLRLSRNDSIYQTMYTKPLP